ncbi:MAG: PKD domain-containing protein [Marinilabiliales bacterium]|nr:PKD domain-containing protein [Marinilabiliales bacterium]
MPATTGQPHGASATEEHHQMTNPDYIYDLPGTYQVTLTLTDGRGRTSTATTIIEALDNPRAAFEITSERVLRRQRQGTLREPLRGSCELPVGLR